MDNVTKITDFTGSESVLGGFADLVKDAGKKGNAETNARGKAMAMGVAMFGMKRFAELLVAPKGDDAKALVKYEVSTEADYGTTATSTVVCTLIAPVDAEHTKRQVYDAFKMAVLAGLPSGMASAWSKHILKQKLSAHEALLVKPASKMISSRLKDWKNGALTRIENANWDRLQEEEAIAAKLADRPELDLKKVAQASARVQEVRIAELITKIRDIAQKDDRDDIPYDATKMAAWCREGYTIMGAAEPIKKVDK
jgi:hypothetical protein